MANKIWSAATGDWVQDPKDWSGGEPGSSDAALILSGEVKVDSLEAVQAGLVGVGSSVGAATLDVDGTLSTGSLDLGEGTLSGSGSIDVTGQFMQGSGSRDDHFPYGSLLAGPLTVTAGSVVVGGGKDDGFTIGLGAALIATGISTIHQGFIGGAGTLQNGTTTDSIAAMTFAGSSTIDAVTYGNSPFNDVTSIGTFTNGGSVFFTDPMGTAGEALDAGEITNDGTIVFDGNGSGADGDVSAASFVNDGTVDFASGTASIGDTDPTAITGSGTIALGSGAIAKLNGGVGNEQTVFFSYGADSTLELTGNAGVLAASFQGQLANLEAGDVIELSSVPYSSFVSLEANATDTAIPVTTTSGVVTLGLSSPLSPNYIVGAVPVGAVTEIEVLARPSDDLWNGKGGDGQWTTAGNWSTQFDGVPTAADSAAINSATVTIAAGSSATAGSLKLTEATLVDSGSLFLHSALELISGDALDLAGGFFSFDSSAIGVTVDKGATLEGGGSFADPFTDDGGTVVASAGQTLSLLSVTRQGTFFIDAGATLEVPFAVNGSTVTFAGPAAELDLGYSVTGTFTGPTLDMLARDDSIAIGFYGDTTPTAVVSDSTLTVHEVTAEDTVFTDTFSLVNPDGGLEFVASQTSDGIVVTAVGQSVACFLAGTRIAIPSGEMPIEHLAAGDHVVTASGIVSPIVWVGRSPFDARRHPRPEQVWPIRIRAGALGENLPRRDLLVSPGHSLLLGGVLLQAERLVNGATIVRDNGITRGEYWHVELPRHDILLSEGVPSESYLDTGNRAAFVDAAQVAALHPDFSPRHASDTCVPLVQDGPKLVAARQVLFDRAVTLGWRPHHEPDLRVTVDGRTVPPVHLAAGRARFTIPPFVSSVRLLSRVAIPRETSPASFDGRRLGACVAGIALGGAGGWRDLQLDDAALVSGWHSIERDNDHAWRWTDGAATLAVSFACELEIHLAGGPPGWSEPRSVKPHAA